MNPTDFEISQFCKSNTALAMILEYMRDLCSECNLIFLRHGRSDSCWFSNFNVNADRDKRVWGFDVAINFTSSSRRLLVVTFQAERDSVIAINSRAYDLIHDKCGSRRGTIEMFNDLRRMFGLNVN